MGKQKLTYDFVKNSFYLERYILLSEEYINCRTKLKYKGRRVQVIIIGKVE